MFGIRAAARLLVRHVAARADDRQAAFLAALTVGADDDGPARPRAGGLDPQRAARVDIILRAMRATA